MGGTGVSRSQVSRLCEEIDGKAKAFLDRPHSALGYLTPAAHAANLAATNDRLRNPDQLRRSSVAPPALLRQIDQRTLAAAG